MIKAGIVINIPRLIHWPDTAFKHSSDNFNICIMGNDRALFQNLKKLPETTVNNHPVKILQFQDENLLTHCQTVFISQSETEILSAITEKTRGLPILTISDIDLFIQRGGMFEIQLSGARMTFKANPSCIKQGGLNASPNLLALATNKDSLMSKRCQ